MEQLQVSTTTRFNRYPELYNFIKQQMPYAERILVFGCSDGSEVSTIRELYFPNAIVQGTDINQQCLEKAKQKNLDVFHVSELREQEPYQIIFANSVLCYCKLRHYPNKIEYPTFVNAIKHLDRKLVTNGLISTANANYLLNEIVPYVSLDFQNIDDCTVKTCTSEGKEIKDSVNIVWRKV